LTAAIRPLEYPLFEKSQAKHTIAPYMSQPISQSSSVFDLSPAEKLLLVEDLWDDLAATPDAIPIHDWQKAEVARRKANLINNPASGMDWEEAKRRIRQLSLLCHL
jgi:putative addiction module component (TIGR02574 family)